MKKHITPAARFIFDAETALKSANLAVLGLSSALKYRLGESDRKEIVAETVAKAWTHRASYDPGKASFPTWAGTPSWIISERINPRTMWRGRQMKAF